MKTARIFRAILIVPLLMTFACSYWKLNGNSDTNPETNFVGTTDNKPLVIKSNNNEAMRVDPCETSELDRPVPTRGCTYPIISK